MSVELSDDQYKKLKRDADDNRSVKSLFRMIILTFILALFMFAYGCHALDMKKQVDQAYTNVQVREIESNGMDDKEYMDWLEARKGN